MLFPNALHEGLRDGSITLTVRRWARSQAKVGGRYKSGGGLLEVTAIDVVPPIWLRIRAVPPREFVTRSGGAGAR